MARKNRDDLIIVVHTFTRRKASLQKVVEKSIKVHVAVCGPGNMNQLKENLAVLELGPMNQEEIDRMRRIGDHVYQKESQLKAQFRLFRSIFQRGTKDNEESPGLLR